MNSLIYFLDSSCELAQVLFLLEEEMGFCGHELWSGFLLLCQCCCDGSPSWHDCGGGVGYEAVGCPGLRVWHILS